MSVQKCLKKRLPYSLTVNLLTPIISKAGMKGSVEPTSSTIMILKIRVWWASKKSHISIYIYIYSILTITSAMCANVATRPLDLQTIWRLAGSPKLQGQGQYTHCAPHRETSTNLDFKGRKTTVDGNQKSGKLTS